MKLKYGLRSNIVAIFELHTVSLSSFLCNETEQKTDVQEKRSCSSRKVKREYLTMRTSERVLNLTSKQHFREIHTQICYADLFLVVMQCFSFSIIAGVKIGLE